MANKITKELLQKWDACTDRFNRFNELFPDGADLETAIKGLVDDKHDDWAYWLFDKCKRDNLFPEVTQKGFQNSGSCNSGDYNSGDYNSGDCNTGDYNSGDCNSGRRNSGDYNTGSYNSGYCNSGDYNSGIFNTITPQVMMFNKLTNLEFNSELIQKTIRLINSIKPILTWIYSENMTKEEKANNPTHITTGGYLKKRDYKYCWQRSWENFNKEDKEFIKSLPNFSAEIFEEITGIKLEISEEDNCTWCNKNLSNCASYPFEGKAFCGVTCADFWNEIGD